MPRELDQPEKDGGQPVDAPPPEKIGFGLSVPAGSLGLASDAGGSHLAPCDVTLVLEDGLLMALGPDGDPVPPASFAAAAARRPHEEVAWRDGPPLPAHRVADALEAQAAARQLGEPMGDAWLLAMLGIGPQPDAAPEAWLRAEELRCDLTAIGDELLVSPTGGEAFLITDAKGEALSRDDTGGIRFDGRGLSAAALADRVRTHVLSRGGESIAAEMALSECTLGLHERMLVLRTPFADIELIEKSVDADIPTVRVFLADGRPVGPAALAMSLGHPSRSESSNAQTMDAKETLGVMAAKEEASAAAPEPAAWMTGADPVPPANPPADHAGRDPIPRASAPTDESERDPIPRTSAPTDELGRDPIPRTSAPDHGAEIIRLPLQPPRPPGGVGSAVVMLAGLPAGATLSAGLADGGGRWMLQPQELAELSLRLPSDGPETFALEVSAISVLGRDGALASASELVTITRGLAPVPLHLDRVLPGPDGGRMDALLLRDLPAGARLSAGTHDPAIDGWIVLPAQVPGLALIRATGQTGACRIRVHGLTMPSAGQARAHRLTTLTVVIG